MKDMLSALLEMACTEKQKQVMELYYKSGKKVPEIAAMLGVSRQNIYRMLKTVRKKLEESKKYF